jgi:hypothetical protein
MLAFIVSLPHGSFLGEEALVVVVAAARLAALLGLFEHVPVPQAVPQSLQQSPAALQNWSH